MAEYVKVEQDGRVAIVTLDHPPVNALSSKLLEELEEEYDRLDRDDETRAIVLRGEGEKAFVAGADITEFPAMREQIEEAAETGSARGIQKLAARMDAGRTPVIAAIHGYCLGGGLELAMACDIRIAAEDAQLGQPEIKLGLIPGGGGTQRLPRLVGQGRALLLNLSGDPISGSQAYDWGLVEQVVPREGLMDAALELARTLSERSPFAMGVIKELASETRDLPLSEGMRREAQGFIKLHRQRGRRRGRDGLPGEAQARVHRTMKAAVLRETGTPLSVEDVPEPEAGDGQSIVDVKAAGINFADVLIKNGHYPQPPKLPTVLGNEVAGDIDGRRVVAFARLSGGGYAERVAVDDEWVFELPAGASYAEGAAFLTTYLTAWIPLIRLARLHRDSNLLVTAAAGGVGTAAIQVGVFAGANVTAAAGSEEKLQLARDLGAQRTVSYEEIGELDDIDVALDPVGGPVFADCINSLRPLGRRDRNRLRRRRVGAGRPGAPGRTQHRRARLLPRQADGLPGGDDPARGRRAAGALAPRRDQARRRRGVPARPGERGARPDRVA